MVRPILIMVTKATKIFSKLMKIYSLSVCLSVWKEKMTGQTKVWAVLEKLLFTEPAENWHIC